MSEVQPKQVLKLAKEEFGIAAYAFFDPLRALFRYLFGTKRYELNYVYNNPKGPVPASERFTAVNDHEARIKALEIVDQNRWFATLAEVREVKFSPPPLASSIQVSKNR